MVFEHIEKLKSEYTDRYVIVDDAPMELARFKGRTAMVKTVNMSGRALVQFVGHNDISWYDIDVDFLRVVEKPVEPEPTPTKKTEKPAGKAAPKMTPGPKEVAAKSSVGGTADILAMARGNAAPEKKGDKPAEKPKGAGTADILAMARGGAAAKEGKSADKPAAKKPSSTDDILAMARGKAAAQDKPTAEKPAAKKPSSTADILAAARGKKAESSPPPPEEPSVPDDTLSDPEPIETPESAETLDTPAVEETTAPAATPSGPLPTETAEILAFCRQRDA
ncbi:MAG: hypothetical protein WD045_00345 [Pirellulaceae bacterium]